MAGLLKFIRYPAKVIISESELEKGKSKYKLVVLDVDAPDTGDEAKSKERINSLTYLGEFEAAAGHSDGSITIWDVEDMEEKSTFQQAGIDISMDFLAYNSNNDTLFSASEETNTIYVWNVSNSGNEELLTLVEVDEAAGSTTSMLFANDYLITGHENGFISVIDSRTYEKTELNIVHQGNVYSIAAVDEESTEGKQQYISLSTVEDKGEVKIWELKGGQITNVQTVMETKSPVNQILVLGDKILVGEGDGNVLIFSKDFANKLHFKPFDPALQAFRIRPSISREGDIKSISVTGRGDTVLLMKVHDDVIRKFGNFGNRFLTTSADDKAKVWETRTLRKDFEFDQTEPIDLIDLPPSDKDKRKMRNTIDYLLFGTVKREVSGIIAEFI
jgi:WD40 repeat protein